jgi:hypothetical protein
MADFWVGFETLSLEPGNRQPTASHNTKYEEEEEEARRTKLALGTWHQARSCEVQSVYRHKFSMTMCMWLGSPSFRLRRRGARNYGPAATGEKYKFGPGTGTRRAVAAGGGARRTLAPLIAGKGHKTARSRFFNCSATSRVRVRNAAQRGTKTKTCPVSVSGPLCAVSVSGV